MQTTKLQKKSTQLGSFSTLAITALAGAASMPFAVHAEEDNQLSSGQAPTSNEISLTAAVPLASEESSLASNDGELQSTSTGTDNTSPIDGLLTAPEASSINNQLTDDMLMADRSLSVSTPADDQLSHSSSFLSNTFTIFDIQSFMLSNDESSIAENRIVSRSVNEGRSGQTVIDKDATTADSFGLTVDSSTVDTTIDNYSITINGHTSVASDNVGIKFLAGAHIEKISNTIITVNTPNTSSSGQSTGIDIGVGSSIGSIESTKIYASAGTPDGSVEGVLLDGTIDKGEAPEEGEAPPVRWHFDEMVITNKNGQSSFISASNSDELAKVSISGNFKMINNNDESGLTSSSYSVGFLVGDTVMTTSDSLGFRLNDGKNISSTGFEIDWNNTSVSIHRDYGLAAGTVATGIGGAMNGTTLGSGCAMSATVKEGIAGTLWVMGTYLNNGSLLGTLDAHADKGSAFGFGTTATDVVQSWLVDQNRLQTRLGDIDGRISASVNTEIAGTKVVGVQVGTSYQNGLNVHLNNSDLQGAFGGDISATLYDTNIGALEGAVNGNLVAGIVDIGIATSAEAKDALVEYYGKLGQSITTDKVIIDKNFTGEEAAFQSTGNAAADLEEIQFDNVIKFDGTITADGAAAGKVAGTSVVARIYDGAHSGMSAAELATKQVAYGHAIVTLIGDMKMSNVGTTASTSATLVGNLTAGAYGNGDQSITFESGHFTVESQIWAATEGVTLGSDTGTTTGGTNPTSIYKTAHVSMKDIATSVGDVSTIKTGKLDFYTNSMSDSSQIHVQAGHALNLMDTTVINIYLAGSEEDYGTLYFIDATAAALLGEGKVLGDKSTGIDGESLWGIEYNLYLNGVEVEQDDKFKIVHDSTGVYLSVPEPSTSALSLVALSGLLMRRRRRASK